MPTVAEVLTAITNVLAPVTPVLGTIEPVLPSVEYVLATVTAILTAVADILDPVTDNGAAERTLREQRGRTDKAEQCGCGQRIQCHSGRTHNDEPLSRSCCLVGGAARLAWETTPMHPR